MRLPPDDSDDITPAESTIKTVDLGSMPTREISYETGGIVHRVSQIQDVELAESSRIGARAQAFKECKRACEKLALSYRSGVLTGVLVTAAIAFVATWGTVLLRWLAQ